MNAKMESPTVKPKLKKIVFRFRRGYQISQEALDDSLDAVLGKSSRFKYYPHCMIRPA